MPVVNCSKDGKPGFSFGSPGGGIVCYLYAAGNDASRRRAKQKAILQGVAIGEESMSSTTEAVDNPTAAQRRDLPAAAFAAPFSEDGDFKRSKSKLPHHINTATSPTSNTTVDVPRLRNALARFNQTDFGGFPAGTKERAKAHLDTHAKALLKTDKSRASQDAVMLFINSDRVPTQEALNLDGTETFGDFVHSMRHQLETFLPGVGIERRPNTDAGTGFSWFIDEVLDGSVVLFVRGNDQRGLVQVDWTRTGQVFAFRNAREVTRRSTFIDMDEALRTLPIHNSSHETESALSQGFKLAMEGLDA